MSLPSNFLNANDYFANVIHFLQQHSWIYENANTSYLKNGVFEQMPEVYKTYFKQIDNPTLNRFPYVHDLLEHHYMPDDIRNFRKHLSQLIPQQAYKEAEPSASVPINVNLLTGMNVKKRHEVNNLVPRIQELINDDQEQYLLLDFGSGLGYLSACLNQLNGNYYILGLDAELERATAATQRLQVINQSNAPTNKRILYKQHFVNDGTTQAFIENTIRDVFQSNYVPTSITKWAIIGLHACADLTITSMKLFFDMPHVRYLVIMPCCYHKLQMCAETMKFRNFPLSKALQETVATHTPNAYVSYLNRPFLRLACQQTLKRWSKCTAEQHQLHGYEMFERATGQVIIDEQEVIVKYKGRPSLTHSNTFEDFCERYQLKNKHTKECLLWRSVHKLRYERLMNKYGEEEGAQLSESLVCLQTAMQKLCENLVLYDRLCFMEETANELNIKIQAQYEKLLNEELSPRCQALIVQKL